MSRSLKSPFQRHLAVEREWWTELWHCDLGISRETPLSGDSLYEAVVHTGIALIGRWLLELACDAGSPLFKLMGRRDLSMSYFIRMSMSVFYFNINNNRIIVLWSFSLVMTIVMTVLLLVSKLNILYQKCNCWKEQTIRDENNLYVDWESTMVQRPPMAPTMPQSSQ